MAQYFEPTENLPIFDSSVFTNAQHPINSSLSGKLDYPMAQGAETLFSGSSCNGDFTVVGDLSIDNKINILDNKGLIVDFPNNDGNLFIGNGSGDNLTTGLNNICIGLNTGNLLTNEFGNIFLGESAGQSLTANLTPNIAIGVYAQNCPSSTTNSAISIGYQAGQQNYGSNNTIIGANALFGQTMTGDNNTLLGVGATTSNPAFNYSTALGYNASITDDNQIMLGGNTEYVKIPNNITFSDNTAQSTAAYNTTFPVINVFLSGIQDSTYSISSGLKNTTINFVDASNALNTSSNSGTGSVSNSTLTVSSHSGDLITNGSYISMSGGFNCFVLYQNSGTIGTIGTYIINRQGTVGSTSFTGKANTGVAMTGTATLLRDSNNLQISTFPTGSGSMNEGSMIWLNTLGQKNLRLISASGGGVGSNYYLSGSNAGATNIIPAQTFYATSANEFIVPPPNLYNANDTITFNNNSYVPVILIISGTYGTKYFGGKFGMQKRGNLSTGLYTGTGATVYTSKYHLMPNIMITLKSDGSNYWNIVSREGASESFVFLNSVVSPVSTSASDSNGTLSGNTPSNLTIVPNWYLYSAHNGVRFGMMFNSSDSIFYNTTDSVMNIYINIQTLWDVPTTETLFITRTGVQSTTSIYQQNPSLALMTPTNSRLTTLTSPVAFTYYQTSQILNTTYILQPGEGFNISVGKINGSGAITTLGCRLTIVILDT